MASLDENLSATNRSGPQSVQTLVIGRLIIVFLLLVSSWVWYTGSLAFSFDNLPQGPLVVFIISVGLTAVYLLLLRISSNVNWQVRTQFILDAFLITWLVWQTGDLSSPYLTLYILLIAISSVYLKPTATLILAVVCIVLFVLLSVLVALAMIGSSGVGHPPTKIVQVVGLYAVAFLVVGLLAARLSDRRTSGHELIAATRSLQSLRAVHERIVESIRSGLITTDLEGRIFTFNAAASEITGLGADAVRGRSISELIANFDEAISMSADVLTTEQPPRFEADLTTPDGFAVRIGYSISQLFSEDNVESGYIITFQDLTEIRSMEESVRRKDRLAAVGRVGAGLAHEIRNPLGAMRGAIQVLESNTPRDSMQADLMGIIMRESDRLNAIITNFLNYARPAAGNFSETDVCDVIRETLKLLWHSPDVKEFHILKDVLPEGPVRVMADASQLKQIFWNLARNSINAMPDGGTLTVSVQPIVNDRVRIIFDDTGCGMSPDQVEQLFEPFSKSTTGGTGLGLSIVYQIIRDHNGTINVRSAEGEGTVITIEMRRELHRAGRSQGEPATAKPDPSPHLIDYLQVKDGDPENSS
jgi:two-component system, NtrC family, sensor histidine kinase PilS